MRTRSAVCPVCGREFETANPATVYCGGACSAEAYAARKARYRIEPGGLTPLERKALKPHVTVDSYLPVRHAREAV